MASDEERREVAARLRTERRHMEDVPVPNNVGAASFRYLVSLISAVRVPNGSNLFIRLADLIEPEEQ